MTIALDFDGTFDRDSTFWREFCDSANKFGHSILIVSCRVEDEEGENRRTIQRFTLRPDWMIKLTGGEAKRHYMERHGWKIDVWIDDEPQHILNGR